MKKIILIILFLCIGKSYSIAKGGSIPPPPPPCGTSLRSIPFNNLVIYGSAALGFQKWYSFDEAINAGYTITVTVKTTGTECTFDGSTKTIAANSLLRYEVIGNTIMNIVTPNNSNWEVTVKIESTCVFDYYMDMGMKYTWTKSLRLSSLTAPFDMQFGQASVCPTNSSTNLKKVLIIVNEFGLMQ